MKPLILQLYLYQVIHYLQLNTIKSKHLVSIIMTLFFGTYLQAAVGIDTQVIYHRGKSEELLNRAMRLQQTADYSKYISFLLSLSVYKRVH